MKTILVACGAGVASSVLINNALQELLRNSPQLMVGRGSMCC